MTSTGTTKTVHLTDQGSEVINRAVQQAVGQRRWLVQNNAVQSEDVVESANGWVRLAVQAVLPDERVADVSVALPPHAVIGIVYAAALRD